jgi:membrane-associated phospholipid phosphatase
MHLLRRSERVVAAYFVYTAVVALVLPVRSPIPAVTIAMNVVVIGGLVLLAYAESLRHVEILRVLRDWYPLALLLLAYREMGWFAPSERTYRIEHLFEGWDKALLNSWGLKGLIEAAGPVVPSLLEIAYSVVYAVPAFSLAMLYAYRKRERSERLLFTVVLGVLMVYALFPYFPSEPPRTVFPGQDLPRYNTIFRQFNWWLLGGYGIHMSVFPSAHVSGAFSSAFAMVRALPEHPWVGRFLLALAFLIATATVYGRYHYVADALAGFGISVVALAIAAAFERRDKSALGRGFRRA